MASPTAEPAPIQAVFFDAVGTLLHPEPPAAQVYAEVGRRHGSRRTADEIAPRFVQAFAREEQHDSARGLATSEARERERWRRIVAEVLDDARDANASFEELFQHFARPTAWRLDADAGPVLTALAARGLVLGMASNYDERLRRVVAGWPELAPIRHLAISSEIGWRKPSPRFFAALTAMTGLPAERILLVGDDLVNDYEGATSAGLQAVLLDPHGRHERPARIRRLVEVPGWIGAQ